MRSSILVFSSFDDMLVALKRRELAQQKPFIYVKFSLMPSPRRFPPPWTIKEPNDVGLMVSLGAIAVSPGPQVRSVQQEETRGGNLNSIPPISGAQIRAARALLKWSMRKLSDQCGVSESAISRGEQVNGRPSMQARTLNTIRRVFEEHGIEFLGLDDVRLLAQSPEVRRAAISGEVTNEGRGKKDCGEYC